MKLKIGEDGKAEVRNEKPVYITDDGKEVEFDVPGAMAKIGELNNEAKTHRLDAKAAKEKLASFAGIEDPEAAKKALQFASSMDGKKIMDDESLKTLIVNSVKPYADKVAELETKTKNQEDHLYKLEVSNKFASSEFVKKTIFSETPEVAEAYFGKNFTVEGNKVVAYDDAKNPILSSIKPGEPAGFEEALAFLVERHAKKDHILKGTGSSGSGAQSGGNGVTSNIKRDSMTTTQKTEFISKHGLEAFQKLPAK